MSKFKSLHVFQNDEKLLKFSGPCHCEGFARGSEVELALAK